MRRIHKLMLGIGALAVLIVTCSPFAMATACMNGNFGGDDGAQLLGFTVGTTNTYLIQSYQYGGTTTGFDPCGNRVPKNNGVSEGSGAIDSILTLFKFNTTSHEYDKVAFNDDCSPFGCAAYLPGLLPVLVDPTTGVAYDSRIAISLTPGFYEVWVTQYDNFANGMLLSDGFRRTGQPDFTFVYGCFAGQFCDVTGSSRINYFDFSVQAVPEPSSLLLLGSGLAGLAGIMRRWKQMG